MPGIRTIADIEAFEATPLSERQLPASTYDALKVTASQHPDLLALAFFLEGTAYQKAVRFTFHELLQRVTQTANMLHSLGVGPSDTVSYILPNLPQTYFTLLGGEAAGIANPINPLLEPHTLADIMVAANTKVLVTLAPFPTTDIWEKVAAIVDQVPSLETVLQVDIAGYLGGVKKIAVSLMRLNKGKEQVRARVLNFDKELARHPSDRLVSGRTFSKEDVAAYFHTGGTTGTPKLAVQTHENQVFDGWVAQQAVDGQPGKINFLGLPLFHNYGAIAIGIGSWIVGSGIIMGTPQGFRGEGVLPNFWKILEYYQCTAFSGVPTVFSTLLNIPMQGEDLSRLETSTCGAAALPVEVARQFTDLTGIDILEGYGLTEGTSVCSVNPVEGTPRIGSIGYRLPYQEMRAAIIQGTQFERFCETDEVGEIIIRGPNVFAGYKDDFHNAGAFVDTGDGKGPWLNTGDLGREDADGFFWLTGRKKELIIRGGHNIDPKQIEEPMHRHPAVALAAAVGRPDPRVGETPVVYVELKPGAQATQTELLEYAREHIGERAAVPKSIYVVDKLPLTAVGKILKRELSQEQVVAVFNEELQQIDGIASSSVSATSDKRLGTVARVTVTAAAGHDEAALEETIRKVLGKYTIHHDLIIS